MYDPISTDTDIRAVQADIRKRRIVERATEAESRAHNTINLKAQIDASNIERAERRREWAKAGLWIFAFVCCVAVLTALVLRGSW